AREQGTGNREQKRGFRQLYFSLLNLCRFFSVHLIAREQGTGNREQKRGFRQLYFSLLNLCRFFSVHLFIEIFNGYRKKI
ncbi:MAG: hypothetical protein ACK45Z_15005, partial [Dolichospermum sp.]